MFVDSENYDHYLNNLCENYSIELLLRHLRDNGLFIDIGVHYGYYTIAAGTKFKNCRIISFEPSPKIITYWKKILN
jgi:precorrin-6B methylase 2